MSQNNNDNSAATGVAFIGAGAVILCMLVAMFLAFIAFLLTLACAWVLYSGKTLRWGSDSITPDEARAFIIRGIAGAFLVPAFATFTVVVFNVHIVPEAWNYFLLGGYVGGSLGIEILKSNVSSGAAEIIPPPAIEHSRERASVPSPWAPRSGATESASKFRFASWNDDEELRK